MEHLRSKEPLGLCYIAAVLEKAGFKVRILDMEILKLSNQDYVQLLHLLHPQIIGFSVNINHL